MTYPACLVLVTCGALDEARRIAQAVVEERLAACVNVIGDTAPILSFYRWQGAMQVEREHMLLIKTVPSQLAALEQRIKALHSYDTPEFIALPIMAGSADYLEWLNSGVE